MSNPWTPLHLMIEQMRKKKMADEFGQLADSGERRTFETGAVRDRGELKPRPDLISPHAQLREGMIMAKGAEKYALRNWERGLPISECLASAQRHIEQFKRGDRDEDHIAQARWNLGVIIHFEEEIKAGRLPASLDDMPRYECQPIVGGIDPSKPVKHEYRIGIRPKVQEAMSEIGLGFPSARLQCEDLRTCDCKNKPWQVCDICQSPESKQTIDQPTFYVAGPMRGFPQFNFPEFNRVAALAREAGYNIISPAEMDLAVGIDPINDPEGAKRFVENNPDHMQQTIERDVKMIMSLNPKRGNGLILLDGWANSVGTRAEVALALWIGLRFKITNPLRYRDKSMFLNCYSQEIERALFKGNRDASDSNI